MISDHTTYHVSSVFIYRNSIHTVGSQLSLSAMFACNLSTLGVSVEVVWPTLTEGTRDIMSRGYLIVVLVRF